MTNKPLTRMCVSTREIKDIKDLYRIVRTPSGIVVIETNEHLPGRGAYISKDKEAINIAKKKKLLNRALRCIVPEEIYEQLLAKC